MTKPYPSNTTHQDNLTSALSSRQGTFVNPWASGPCYAPGTVASTFCSCSQLWNSLAKLQTVTTTGTPPDSAPIWTDTLTISTITEKSFQPPKACCSTTCDIYASSVQIIYWNVDLNTMNSSVTAAPTLTPYSTVDGNFTLQVPP